MKKLLLTSIQGYPIIIDCPKISDIQTFHVKNAIPMTEEFFRVNKHNWTQETSNIVLASIINDVVGERDCWIQKEDAK